MENLEMIYPRGRRVLAVVLLSVVLLTTACTAQAPSRFDQVQQESSKQKTGQAVAKNATQGSKLNKFFPGEDDDYQRVFTQEKKGFAEAKLKKDGKDLAMLSISDTTSTPGAAAKFSNSSKQIGGYPAVLVGNTQTAVLVGKYQVKVLSRSPSFTASDRADWLEKFNLDELAKLK
jgi:Tfp pilus assembly protein PilV